MPKSKSRRKKSRKRVLALPDLEHANAAVLNSQSAEERAAILEFDGYSSRDKAQRMAFKSLGRPRRPEYTAIGR